MLKLLNIITRKEKNKMKKMVKNPTKISVYLNKDEKAWLEKKADQNGRSISNYVRMILREKREKEEDK